MISESDIDPVEYCAVPNAYLAASVRRWVDAPSLAFDVVVVIASVFVNISLDVVRGSEEEMLDALVYFDRSIPPDVDEVVIAVDAVVVDLLP